MPPIKFLDLQLDHKGIIFLSNPYLYSISFSNWGFENAMLTTSPCPAACSATFPPSNLVTLKIKTMITPPYFEGTSVMVSNFQA